jgi:hypothetical protein
MKNSMKSLMVAAACSGLFTGATAIPAMAQSQSSQTAVTQMGQASFVNAASAHHVAKHACKGQNNCKGQGGCKSSDNGCKAKNSCKGKGGCATDGSKMPSLI